MFRRKEMNLHFSCCRFLFSGTSDGQIVAFDLNDNKEIKLPIWTRKVADCCVPSVRWRVEILLKSKLKMVFLLKIGLHEV